MDELARAEILKQLGDRYGERLRGKILQRLLELAFHRAGYRLVEERMSEGTDFDVCHRLDPDRRYSLEVRTSREGKVPVKPEDLRLMDERSRDGYATGLAALRVGPNPLWVFIRREELSPPWARISVGTSDAWRDLDAEVNPAFRQVLAEKGSVAVEEGLDGLVQDVEQATR